MDEDAKTELLRSIPYGLYAACTTSPEADPHAFLLSWVTQASFEPPLLVACVHTDSTAYEHLTAPDGGQMAINLLGVDQQPFATSILQGAAFDEDEVSGEPYKLAANGCALIPSTLGALEVEVLDETAHGDHAVFVCEVTDAHAFREGDPLTHESTGWTYGG